MSNTITTAPKLEVNQEFKSIKALADYLSYPLPTGGTARQAALKKWKKYFLWEKTSKNSHSIKIVQIYNQDLSVFLSSTTKKPNEDYINERIRIGAKRKACKIYKENRAAIQEEKRKLKEEQLRIKEEKHQKQILKRQQKEAMKNKPRKQRTGKYSPYIKDIIYETITKNPDNILIAQKYKLFKELGMINENYVSFNREKTYAEKINYLHELNVSQSLFQHFKLIFEQKLNQILDSSFNILFKEGFCVYENSYYVTTTTGISRVATDFESGIINSIEEDTLKEFGLKNMAIVWLSKQYSKFYASTKKLLHSQTNLIEYNRIKKITLTDENYTPTLNDPKSTLNSLVVSSVLKAFQSKYNNSMKNSGQPPFLCENYMDIMLILVDAFCVCK